GGESERIIGNWMKERNNRSEIIIATKVGSSMSPTDPKNNLRKAYIIKAVEDSLRRLKTDYIDLYQTHSDDIDTPVESTLETSDGLIIAGKVRWIGTSNMSPERLKESLDAADRLNLPRYQTLQPEYNLYSRESFEKQYLQIALDEQLSVIPYYSLASGFLTGKYRSGADLKKS